MTLTSPSAPRAAACRSQLIGGWEVGLLVFMVLLYVAGAFINPGFFGATDAFSAVLRDAARFGVMAVGMTFVIVNKDLDLSVGSTLGLIARRLLASSSRRPTTTSASSRAIGWRRPGVGLWSAWSTASLVTFLRVPAFIATLTMLFIGRGFVLGLTGGKTISYTDKARDYRVVLPHRRDQRLGLQQPDLSSSSSSPSSARWCSPRPAGATRPSRPAATSWRRPMPASRPTGCACAPTCSRRLRDARRPDGVAQDKGITSQYGPGAELIVIAAVIVGGASILGGRGRVLGALLGAHAGRADRQGAARGHSDHPHDQGRRRRDAGQGIAQLPPGAVPAFLGLILLVAVLIEPWMIRRNALGAALGAAARPAAAARARYRRRRHRGRADQGQRRRPTVALGATRHRQFLARRDAAAIILLAVAALAGRPLRCGPTSGADLAQHLQPAARPSPRSRSRRSA